MWKTLPIELVLQTTPYIVFDRNIPSVSPPCRRCQLLVGEIKARPQTEIRCDLDWRKFSGSAIALQRPDQICKHGQVRNQETYANRIGMPRHLVQLPGQK